MKTREDGSEHRRGASFRQKEGRARGTERGETPPEMQKTKLQHQHCRQTDAQVVEPGADSTLLIVIVSGECGKQENREVGREYCQSESGKRMNPSAGKKHPYRLRKSTELTGIRTEIYRKPSVSSSERKAGSSRCESGLCRSLFNQEHAIGERAARMRQPIEINTA